MANLLLFLPEEALPLLIAAGGIAVILGARRLGGALVALAIGLAVLPVLLEPLFSAMPGPLLALVLVVLFAGMAFALLRGFSKLMIGERATDHMVGTLAADVVRGTVVGSTRLLWRGLRGAGRRMLPRR